MKSTQCRETDLADALEALRQAELQIHAPSHVEAAVLAAWDSAHAERASLHRRHVWSRWLAVAAGVVIAVGLGRLGHELRRTMQAPAESVEHGRTLLLVGEPILQGEPVRVVRMRVPTSTLTGLGVRPAASDVAHVDVDVIVGEDGVARAIRVGM